MFSPQSAYLKIVCFVLPGLLMACPLFGNDLAGSRPNIVFVIADDLGYGDIARHGNDIVQTPHLDRLHDKSLRFTDFHVSPTCSPTRSALMSGRHEFKNGVSHTCFERERMALSTITIAQVLQKSGYSTGIFGKWHLGDEDEYQPDRRGFDEVFIHGGGGVGQTFPGSCGDAPNNQYFNPTIRHNGVFVRTRGFDTDVFFDQAIRWIDSRRESGEPFFAWISTNTPHSMRLNISQGRMDLYRYNPNLSEEQKVFYGMISNLDDNVGKLLAQLKEWDLDKNTLFIFTSDNGSAVGRYNAGMRGIKGSPFQGGTRVPMFVYWLGRIESGVANQLTAHIDIFATFAELAGAPIPDGVNLDGRNLLPIYQDRNVDWADRYLFTHVGRWQRGRASESKYRNCAVRTARFRLVNNTMLHDILNDPGETVNVIDQFPEEVAKMRAAYDEWWEEVLPLLINEDADRPAQNPFKVRYWEQFMPF